jgi:hypothetical protein
MALDAKFFRKAKKANRAVEITDTEAIIPAVKTNPEIRVALPNRRIRTFEERQEALEVRRGNIEELEEKIEVERKKLLELVKSYRLVGAGAADVVVQNQKIKELMERRSALARPEIWIEDLEGLTLKDVFESKRDIRKIGKNVSVYQVKRRVEPITSLYVDVGVAAADAVTRAETEEAERIAATIAADAAKKVAKTAAAIKATEAPVERTAEQAAQGAIIGKKLFTLKKKANPT